MTHKHALMLTLAALILGSQPVWAHETTSKTAQAGALNPGARAAASIVNAFHAALASGDVPAALGHLSEDATIFESGGVERGKAEYAAHHAPADAAFARAVPSRTTRRSGNLSGDTAWILTEGRTTGTYNGKAVDRVTTETMLLRRTGGVWRIVHIHWSSAAARRAA
ncbi:ketosteroid isomerase-like protein [Sphingomonas jejuensis]|uniref:Ketosteroid isomerase-like protein n=1 Tax=Sphingomonas jejuensis TaxID=904715 RepID=A0ABX0XIG7_9SPHN|nr:nuclear transport factor 2 family protein [Sphingomonas jejuensis]NJC32611.1 ketosteroid isomerase-like protein [Sphingomonas jejuensis]